MNWYIDKEDLDKEYTEANQEYLKQKYPWYAAAMQDLTDYATKKFPSNVMLHVYFNSSYYTNEYQITYLYDGQKRYIQKSVNIEVLESVGQEKITKIIVDQMVDDAVNIHGWDEEQRAKFIMQLGGIAYSVKAGNINPLTHYSIGYAEAKPVAPMATINNKSIETLARALPGVMTRVNPPESCTCYNHRDDKTGTLYDFIIHLNDVCGWSRENIADWIAELEDRGVINTDFPTPGLDSIDDLDIE